MKKILLACFASVQLFGIECESLFENDVVNVSRVVMDAHEEVGEHRDALPRIVIGLKGGVVTRLEANGTETKVAFPTGVAVRLGIDPEGELHRAVNHGDEAVELLVIQMKQKPEHTHDIAVDIRINCPKGEEYKAFCDSIPASGDYDSSFEEWKNSFTHNMTRLLELVESGKLTTSWWSVVTN